MTDDNVTNFPKWKVNCTPAEKLSEALIIIWTNAEGVRCQEVDKDIEVSLAVYLLEQTKFDMLSRM